MQIPSVMKLLPYNGHPTTINN